MAKRVTAEEKVAKIAAFFRKKPDFYTLKDLEKQIPKECGISAMQMGEFLQSAIDENLVNREKAGITNLYWAFEKQEHHRYSCENEKLNHAIANYEREIEKKESHIKTLDTEQEDTEERRELMAQYQSLKRKVAKIEEINKKRELCSAELYRENQLEIERQKDEINRMTDNLFMLQSYVCKKFGIDRRDFCARVGMPTDLDFIE